MKSTIKKFQRNLQDYGWGIVLQKSFLRLSRVIFEKQSYRVYRAKIDEVQPKIDNNSPFTFKVLEKDDGDLINQVEIMVEWLEGQLQNKIAAQDICLVALDGDTVAGLNLVYFNEFFISFVKIGRKLRKHEAWSEHIAVHKNYRKRGLASQLRYRIFRELKKRGIKKFYGGALTFNEPALGLARKVGFNEIADVHYWKIFNIQRWQYQRIR